MMGTIPADLDLSNFPEAILIQVALGEFQVQFNFHPGGTISVEDRWEVIGQNGKLIDRSMANSERESCRLHKLLGQQVKDFHVSAPNHFDILFANGLALRIFASSDGLESSSIEPGNVIV
jgi:hypothetical protein